MLKPHLSEITKNMTLHESGIFYTYRGSVHAPQRLYLLAMTHGNEIAGPIAVSKLIEAEWRWPNVQMVTVFQDPDTYIDEGYGFVSSTEKEDEAAWPPLWGYRQDDERFWFYVDENSAWGNNAIVPDRHQKMREIMHELEPTFTLSLHETVQKETKRNEFWAGAGNLLIEIWPMNSAEISSIIQYEGNPLSNPLGWAAKTAFEFIRGILRIPRWKVAVKALKNNPHYQLTTKIAEKYVGSGGQIAGKKWTEYLEYLRDMVVGPGRLVHGPEWALSEWKTATDYAATTFGCPGVTTETFQSAEIGLRGLDDRVQNQLLYITAVLDVLNEEGS
jgi:hypothetical protein